MMVMALDTDFRKSCKTVSVLRYTTAMVALLFNILIALLIIALVYWVMTLLPIPPQVRTIILVLLVLMVLVYFLAPWAHKQPRITDAHALDRSTEMLRENAAVLHYGALPS